jgi:predicted ATPase
MGKTEDVVFLTRIVLKNYKSIASCSVKLNPLNFFVGQNGAGKSNFLDALRFVSESINTSIEYALRERGGINEVRRRSSGHPTHFGIRLEFSLPDIIGFYAFRVGARPKSGYEIQREECRYFRLSKLKEHYFEVSSGRIIGKSEKTLPPASIDRLFLVAAAGIDTYRPIYDALSHMGFYNFSPNEIRDMQPPNMGEVLLRDGSNLASVLELMEKESPDSKRRVVEFLEKVVPGITGVSVKHVAKKETLEFKQKVKGSSAPWRFMADNMSDGTLRALGVLVALFQSVQLRGKKVRLVGIEEPEVALHPGALGVIIDVLISASARTQILVTSHSPDLLDDKSITDSSIYPVINTNGETIIGSIDSSGRSMIKKRLYTAGELLRMNQLNPDIKEINKISGVQLDLFSKLGYANHNRSDS